LRVCVIAKGKRIDPAHNGRFDSDADFVDGRREPVQVSMSSLDLCTN
jgi:hypothetical protein